MFQTRKTPRKVCREGPGRGVSGTWGSGLLVAAIRMTANTLWQLDFSERVPGSQLLAASVQLEWTWVARAEARL